ncbi:sulfite exporter TauE/SafE family protein [Coleofasciculus sp. G2-EDA-02]|uniref:sulfite exporter TauE/SafE family protein n=1 Tax=Coleofasciculus sp. G2-EDA-02 TaxID=3069529 RepID=UPI0032F2526B
MTPTQLLIFASAGLFAGILAGFLGIGGGTVLVPLLVTLGYDYQQAVATSTLSIVITAISGTLQNWRLGNIDFKRIIAIGFPAIITAPIGAYLTELFADYWLKAAFGLLLLINIYLVRLRKRLKAREKQDAPETENQRQTPHSKSKAALARIATGSAAGLLAGVFGVGGGVIMVPLQILLLGESIKTAIQTSLGVIVITAISACIGHAVQGNVLWIEGLLLGTGGLLGAQISTRFLPKLPDQVVSLAFSTLLAILAIYFFWQAWQSYINGV